MQTDYRSAAQPEPRRIRYTALIAEMSDGGCKIAAISVGAAHGKEGG
jgi:hypothetical protein